jgi:acetyl-CoA carboxylase carboxyl transferase subunit beta
MSWITRLRNRVQSFTQKRDTPDNLWHKCRNCGQLLYRKDFIANLSVCTHCGFHERIGPAERFAQLFDDSLYSKINVPHAAEDPLKFKDTKKYVDRLKDARASTGETDAVSIATGEIGGTTTVVVVQNFAFMAGSMGVGVGEGLLKAAQEACRLSCPLVVFTAAGGARMQEGILSLMQMPRTTVAVAQLKEAGLPYVVVLTDPTTGGVTASYAMLGDIQFAEPGALIGFAGQRVIENTIREKLPEGFQRAEYLLAHGMIDQVVPRAELRTTLGVVLKLLMQGKGQRAARIAAAPAANLPIPSTSPTPES